MNGISNIAKAPKIVYYFIFFKPKSKPKLFKDYLDYVIKTIKTNLTNELIVVIGCFCFIFIAWLYKLYIGGQRSANSESDRSRSRLLNPNPLPSFPFPLTSLQGGLCLQEPEREVSPRR